MSQSNISIDELRADGWIKSNDPLFLMEKKIENRNPLNASEDTDIKLDEEAEHNIVSMIDGPTEKKNLNASLDKYSQPMQLGPNMADNHKHAGYIMKARQVNKSSKGKYPKNYTPPKKKRK